MPEPPGADRQALTRRHSSKNGEDAVACEPIGHARQAGPRKVDVAACCQPGHAVVRKRHLLDDPPPPEPGAVEKCGDGTPVMVEKVGLSVPPL